MTKIALIILIVSLLVVAYIWVPTLLDRHKKAKEVDKPIIYKSSQSHNKNINEFSKELETPVQEVQKDETEKSKTDWRVIISWIIGSLNGVLLILSQFQRVFGHK